MLTLQTDVVIRISNNFGDRVAITTAEDVFYRYLSKPDEYEMRCDFVFHKIEEQEWNDLMTCLKNGHDSIWYIEIEEFSKNEDNETYGMANSLEATSYIKVRREDGSISFSFIKE